MKNLLSYGLVCFSVLIIAYAFVVYSSENDAIEFLSYYGWQVEEKPIESAPVLIPEEFDTIFEDYNLLQKEAGLDLKAYRGQKGTRYTYRVMNYPENIENVRANVIVIDGKAVGGDISTVALDGFMHSLKYSFQKS